MKAQNKKIALQFSLKMTLCYVILFTLYTTDYHRALHKFEYLLDQR